jgi:hypothetical protein
MSEDVPTNAEILTLKDEIQEVKIQIAHLFRQVSHKRKKIETLSKFCDHNWERRPPEYQSLTYYDCTICDAYK